MVARRRPALEPTRPQPIARAEDSGMKKLDGMKVAIVVADGFEEVELTKPKKALENEGAITEIVSAKDGKVKAWAEKDWGSKFAVDRTFDEAKAGNYDALLLPGGVMNPDKLRMDPRAVAFVRAFVDAGKPIAAICHGPWTLVETGFLRGKRVTSYPSIKTDLVNAGALWTDAEAVVDGGLVTSRKPADIPAFDERMIETFAAHRKAQRTAA
jgi:protease I